MEAPAPAPESAPSWATPGPATPSWGSGGDDHSN
jgi:hypothetical protein